MGAFRVDYLAICRKETNPNPFVLSLFLFYFSFTLLHFFTFLKVILSAAVIKSCLSVHRFREKHTIPTTICDTHSYCCAAWPLCTTTTMPLADGTQFILTAKKHLPQQRLPEERTSVARASGSATAAVQQPAPTPACHQEECRKLPTSPSRLPIRRSLLWWAMEDAARLVC